jgi:hypothetical protein
MHCKYVILSAVLAFAGLQIHARADISLGSAQDFAVLGASTVTNTGSTTIYGNVGVDPGSAITGFYPPGTVSGGSIYGPGGVSNLAQSDALTAYNTLKALPYAYNLTGQDLGLQPALVPGVYHFDTSAQLTGTLTLDFATDPDGDFVFQIGTALTTASSSSVNVLNGSSLSGVYWQVGSSATLGSSTVFAGNILADQSITLNTTASILCGRAIALNAAVTMDTNRISNDNTAQDFHEITGSVRSDFGSYGFSGGAPAGPVAVRSLAQFCLSAPGWGVCLPLEEGSFPYLDRLSSDKSLSQQPQDQYVIQCAGRATSPGGSRASSPFSQAIHIRTKIGASSYRLSSCQAHPDRPRGESGMNSARVLPPHRGQ